MVSEGYGSPSFFANDYFILSGRMGTTSRQFLPIFFGFEIHIISMIPHSDPLWGLFLPIKEEYTMRILLIEPNKIP